MPRGFYASFFSPLDYLPTQGSSARGYISSMDKKSGYLILAVWAVPILISMKIERWWVTCLTGVISLLMGVFLLIYPRTRDARFIPITMIVVGVLSQAFAIMEFQFRGLSK
jgi:hypothetical protein